MNPYQQSPEDRFREPAPLVDELMPPVIKVDLSVKKLGPVFKQAIIEGAAKFLQAVAHTLLQSVGSSERFVPNTTTSSTDAVPPTSAVVEDTVASETRTDDTSSPRPLVATKSEARPPIKCGLCNGQIINWGPGKKAHETRCVSASAPERAYYAKHQKWPDVKSPRSIPRRLSPLI